MSKNQATPSVIPSAVAQQIQLLKAAVPPTTMPTPATPILSSTPADTLPTSAMDVDKEVVPKPDPRPPPEPYLYSHWEDEGDSEDEDSDTKGGEDELKRLKRAKLLANQAKDPLPPFRPRSEFPARPSPVEPPTRSATPKKWPSGFPVPALTSPFRAGTWFEFVPRTSSDARRIVDAAQKGDDEAVWRIKHLLEQGGRDTRLAAVNGMYSLQQIWRNPKRPTTQHISIRTEAVPQGNTGVVQGGTSAASGTPWQARRWGPDDEFHHLPPPTTGINPPPGLFSDPPSSRKRKGKAVHEESRSYPVPGSSTATSNEPAPKRKKGPAAPRRGDPPERWQEYWKVFADQIPAAIRVASDGTPLLEDVRAFTAIRLLAATSQSKESRKAWISRAQELFSVAGLYAEYVQRYNLTVAPTMSANQYPRDGSNATWGDLAEWFATNGLQPNSSALREIEEFCRRVRNLESGRSVEDGSPFDSIPQDLSSEQARLNTEPAHPPREPISLDVAMADAAGPPTEDVPHLTIDATAVGAAGITDQPPSA